MGRGPTDDIFRHGLQRERPEHLELHRGKHSPPKDDVVNQISINGAAPIAGEIAFRFFPVSGRAESSFLYGQLVAPCQTNGDAHIDYEFNQAGPPRPIRPVPAARNYLYVQLATS